MTLGGRKVPIDLHGSLQWRDMHDFEAIGCVTGLGR